MLPDPAFYADCLQASFEELRDAALGKAPDSKKPARKKAAAKKTTPVRKKTAAAKKAPRRKAAGSSGKR